MSESGQKWKVAGWIALAFLAGALDPILVKYAYRDHITTVQLLILRNILAAALQILVIRGIPKDGFLSLLGSGVLLFMAQGLYIAALQFLPVVVVIACWTAAPAMVSLLNVLLGREKLEWKFWLGFVLCFCGVLLTLEPGHYSINSGLGLGLILAVCGVLSSACYRVSMEIHTSRHKPSVAAAWTFVAQGVISMIFIPWIGVLPASAFGYGTAMAIGGAIGNIAFISALSMVGATRISVLSLLHAPLMAVVAAVTLNEPLTIAKGAGVLLVAFGVRYARVTRVAPAGEKPLAEPKGSQPIETKPN